MQNTSVQRVVGVDEYGREIDQDGDLIFELRENVVDDNGNKYKSVVEVNNDIFKGKNKIKALKNFVYNNLSGKQITIFDDKGNSKVIEFARNNERVKKDNAKNLHKVIDKLAYKKDRNSQLAVANSVELVEVSLFDDKNNRHTHQWLDENGWEYRKSYRCCQTVKFMKPLLISGKQKMTEKSCTI